MRPRIALAVLSVMGLLSVGCTQPPKVVAHELPHIAPGRYDNHFKIKGIDRTYLLHVPKAYDASKSLPLVVLLHGFTSSSEMIDTYTGFAAKAEREGFVLATPQGLGNPTGWNVGYMDLSGKAQDDVNFVSRVIDDASKKVGIDTRRIFVAGHSNGAMLAYLAGAKLSSRVAAVAGYAGVIGIGTSGKTQQISQPSSPLSVMVIHGMKDAMVGYRSDSQALLRGIGAEDGAVWWAKAIGAGTNPVTTRNSEKTMITRTYTKGRQGTEVVFVTLENGTHNWAQNATFNATDAMWDFFKAHAKR